MKFYKILYVMWGEGGFSGYHSNSYTVYTICTSCYSILSYKFAMNAKVFHSIFKWIKSVTFCPLENFFHKVSTIPEKAICLTMLNFQYVDIQTWLKFCGLWNEQVAWYRKSTSVEFCTQGSSIVHV